MKRERLEWLTNELIDASNRTIPRHIRDRWAGNTCIDATFVKAFANQKRKSERGSIEPDVWWYRRDGDHRVTQGDLNSGRTIPKLAYGWKAHLVIASSNRPDEHNEFPITVTAMTFDRPGKRTAKNTVTAYTQMHLRGMPAGIATDDLNYWPAQKADKMQLPIRALGHGNVNEYRTDQLGVQANHAGGIQVEGHWYCPSMPKDLIDATIDHRVNHTIDDFLDKHERIAPPTPLISRRAGKRRTRSLRDHHPMTKPSHPPGFPLTG